MTEVHVRVRRLVAGAPGDRVLARCNVELLFTAGNVLISHVRLMSTSTGPMVAMPGRFDAETGKYDAAVSLSEPLMVAIRSAIQRAVRLAQAPPVGHADLVDATRPSSPAATRSAATRSDAGGEAGTAEG